MTRQILQLLRSLRMTMVLLPMLISCGYAPMDVPPELAGRQPFVVKALPSKSTPLAAADTIALTFSQPIDPETVHASSIVLYRSLDEATVEDDIVGRWDNLQGTDVELTMALSADQQTLRIAATQGFPQERVGLLISSAILSVEGLPFSQAPGLAQRPYVALYHVATDAQQATTTQTTTTSDGTTTTSPETSTNASPTETAQATPVANPPASLMINEFLYDVPGSDTNGVVFVELRGTPGGDISGHVIRLLNGDGAKVTDTIAMPSGSVIPDDGFFVIADGMTGNTKATTVPNADLVDNFDPQNGPDAVQLLAPDGRVVDALGYGSPLPLHDSDGLLVYEGNPAEDAPAGQSLSRLPEAADTDENATDFVIQAVPTPGGA